MPVPSRALVLLPGILALLSLAAAPCPAETPVLVRDFAPGTTAFGVAPKHLASVAGRLYFAGNDPDSGYEPWESDGTMAGTRQLADLCPGSCSSYPKGFTQLDDAVAFYAYDADNRSRVYLRRADEIREVVRLEEQIFAWARLGPEIFFLTQGDLLYRTDGSAEGTRLVRSFCPAPLFCDTATELTEIGGALYFSANREVYRLGSGGLLEPILPLPGPPTASSASRFTALPSGGMIFVACAGPWGSCRLYVSDGTAAGTHQLEAPPGQNWVGTGNFITFRGRIFFEAATLQPYRIHIVSTDGTTAGTRVENAIGGDYPSLLAADQKRLYFVGPSANGTKLAALSADGVTITTLLENQSYYAKVAQLGNQLLFNYGHNGSSLPPTPGDHHLGITHLDGNGITELAQGSAEPGTAMLGPLLFFNFSQNKSGLWLSDGSPGGTGELDLGLLTPDSSLAEPHLWGSDLIVEARPSSNAAKEIWQLSPSASSGWLLDPRPLRVVAAGRELAYLADATQSFEPALHVFRRGGTPPEEIPLPGHYVDGSLADNDHFFFSEDSSGQRLWESDGSLAGTRVLFEADEVPCVNCFRAPVKITATGDSVFYVVGHSDDSGAELWVWNRIRQTRNRLADSTDGYFNLIGLAGGRAAFRVTRSSGGEDWWITDGSAEGTRIFASAPASYYLRQWVLAGQKLFLDLGDRSGTGSSLWTSDLTSAGTLQVLPPAPGFYQRLLPAGNDIFFVFESGQQGQIGFSDGTMAGTRLLQQPAPQNRFSPVFVTQDFRWSMPPPETRPAKSCGFLTALRVARGASPI